MDGARPRYVVSQNPCASLAYDTRACQSLHASARPAINPPRNSPGTGPAPSTSPRRHCSSAALRRCSRTVESLPPLNEKASCLMLRDWRGRLAIADGASSFPGLCHACKYCPWQFKTADTSVQESNEQKSAQRAYNTKRPPNRSAQQSRIHPPTLCTPSHCVSNPPGDVPIHGDRSVDDINRHLALGLETLIR